MDCMHCGWRRSRLAVSGHSARISGIILPTAERDCSKAPRHIVRFSYFKSSQWALINGRIIVLFQILFDRSIIVGTFGKRSSSTFQEISCIMEFNQLGTMPEFTQPIAQEIKGLTLQQSILQLRMTLHLVLLQWIRPGLLRDLRLIWNSTEGWILQPATEDFALKSAPLEVGGAARATHASLQNRTFQLQAF